MRAPASGVCSCLSLSVNNVQTSSPNSLSQSKPPWEGGTKVYINGPGHMTKMAATPIYGKNL